MTAHPRCPTDDLGEDGRPLSDRTIFRRSLLLGGGAAALGLLGAGACGVLSAPSRGGNRSSTGSQPSCPAREDVVFGSSAATWQLSDPEYRRLFVRHAEILFTEDDLLWYRLRRAPDSDLDFTYADKIINFAERHEMFVFGAHLVWDQGFGEGWKEQDVWGMDEKTARSVLFGTARRLVARYRGRVDAWSVVNEAISSDGIEGLRTDVPWYESIGPSYVAEAFRIARAEDPDAVLVINEFGFETPEGFGEDPVDKRRAVLQVLDALIEDEVPVDALGIQGHLMADDFGQRFDADAYHKFLAEVADRGLDILITELDVLDDGLPADRRVRDRAVADAYRRYLDAALAEPAVKAVITFGLSDRYTWLQEDYPRDDGAPRRPLPFDEAMRPKPAYRAVTQSLRRAAPRCPLWEESHAISSSASTAG
jgi:endo-1,4-beta-xylanase